MISSWSGLICVDTDTSRAATSKVVEQLQALNDPKRPTFEPTVSVMWDYRDLKLHKTFDRLFLQPCIRWGKTVVRHDADVVMLTHLIVYFTTSVPSALYLYCDFHWWHGVLHWLMQTWYAGSYTLMMHQHIHQRGILMPQYKWFDRLFPYITDPLMGHTWNTYYIHHVKHHHVEGNGPGDLSSTIRYQRDNPLHFLCYFARFALFTWVELPIYFISRKKAYLAGLAGVSEGGCLIAIYLLASKVNFKATLWVFILPLCLLRLGLMIGNWGQHAFVDELEPDSDFRSSITLIDVPVSFPWPRPF